MATFPVTHSYASLSINIHHGKDMDIYNEQLQKTYDIANTLPVNSM